MEVLRLIHRGLAGVRAEVGLAGLGEDDAQCAVGGGERTRLLDGEGAGQRLERGRDEAERIEIEFELRFRRARRECGAEFFQTRGNLLRRGGADHTVEPGVVEIEQHRQRDGAHFADPAGRFHRRAIHDARDPRLLPQRLPEVLGESVEIHRAGLVHQRESQLARLAEFAVESLERPDGIEVLRQEIEHVGGKARAERDDQRRGDEQRRDPGEQSAAAVRDEVGKRAVKAHARGTADARSAKNHPSS